MANTIPCPNPVCTHQFGLAELQSAAQLLCPKCGFRMQGKAAAPKVVVTKPAAAPKPVVAPKVVMTKPAAAPKVVMTKPVAAPPKPTLAQPVSAPAPTIALATPVAAQPKLATPVSAAPMPPLAAPVAAGDPPVAPSTGGEASVGDGMFFNPEVGTDAGTLVRATGKPKRKFNWMRMLVMFLSFGFAASIVIVAITGTLWFFLGTDGVGGLKENTPGSIYYGQIRGSKDGNEKIYKLVILKEQWEIDRDVLKGLDAHAAWKHKEYDFWFAIVVQDYGLFKPRDAEMLRMAIDKLESFFGDALEVGKKAEPAKIGERAAQKIEFKGQIKAANWSGECYMFFNNGIAYWLYIASPDKSTVDFFADQLPKENFFVESERRGWREQPPPMKTFASTEAKVVVTVPEGVWEKHPNAKDLDERGILYLSGTYKKEKDNRKNASILVYTFEKKGDVKDAMKMARDSLDSMVKNENENYKVALAVEVTAGQSEVGALDDIGNRRGRLIDLKRSFNDEIQRYILLAVVNEPDVVYGIRCECGWESRQIWRQDFMDVMRSMKFKKAE